MSNEPLDDLDAPHPIPPGPGERHRAFEDMEFMRSVDGRQLRILAEFLEPQFRLRRHGIEDTIVFFGSSRAEEGGPAPLRGVYGDARALGRRLTEWSESLSGGRRFVVVTGGGPGVMEAGNRGAMDANGPSVGFGISIPHEQVINAYVTPDLAFNFHYFFMRKFWFVYNAKALVFFPGGFGTMDELMEVLTLVQTHKVHKPMGIVLYGAEFWERVLNFDALVEYGVISPEDRQLFVVCDTVDDAFQRIRGFLHENYGPTLLRGL